MVFYFLDYPVSNFTSQVNQVEQVERVSNVNKPALRLESLKPSKKKIGTNGRKNIFEGAINDAENSSRHGKHKG